MSNAKQTERTEKLERAEEMADEAHRLFREAEERDETWHSDLKMSQQAGRSLDKMKLHTRYNNPSLVSFHYRQIAEALHHLRRRFEDEDARADFIVELEWARPDTRDLAHPEERHVRALNKNVAAKIATDAAAQEHDLPRVAVSVKQTHYRDVPS